MASECCTKPGIQTSHTPKGKFRNIAGNNTYESGSGEKVVFYLTDVYGNEIENSTNNHHLADAIADAGFHVYMPDLFDGKPMPTGRQEDWAFAQLPIFLPKHPPDDVEREHIKDSILYIIENHSNKPKSIQFIGICYGAKPITVLLKDNRINSVTRGIVFNHPSFLTNEDADTWNMNIPLHINESSNDVIFKGELREYWENTLGKKKVLSFKEYPGTEHGFSTRPQNENQEKQRVLAEDAAINFFKKHIDVADN